MLDNQPNLEAWMNGGEVQRFHQWPMLHRQQTVAEHTFNMLLISTHLYYSKSHEFAELQHSILFHDIAEGRRGISDISSYAKRQFPGLREAAHKAEAQVEHRLGIDRWTSPYSNLNENRLKMCDKLELMWTVISQLMLGNRTLYDASWPVIIGMVGELYMDVNEHQLIEEWSERAIKIRG